MEEFSTPNINRAHVKVNKYERERIVDIFLILLKGFLVLFGCLGISIIVGWVVVKILNKIEDTKKWPQK